MAQHYFPDLRIPYDTDGTRVFYRRGNITDIFVTPPAYEKEWREVDPAGLAYLNSARRYSLAFGPLGANNISGSPPYYGAWEIGIIFPEPMDISGIYFTSGEYNIGPLYEGLPASWRPYISVSADTTALDDGHWSTPVHLDISTKAAFTTTKVSPLRQPVSVELPNFRIYNQDLGAPSWLPAGIDTYGSYREQMPYAGKGIVPTYGEEYRYVKGLRIVMKDDQRPGDIYFSPWLFFGTRNNLHLYGSQTLTSDLWGLQLVNDDGSPIGPDDLVLGNLPQPLTAGTLTYTWPKFRVKNFSDTETANSIILRVREDEEQRFVVSIPGWEGNDLMYYVSARVGTGSWQVASPSNIDLTIGNLAPGAVSDPIEVKVQTIDYATTGQLPFFGANLLRFQPIVGSWS